jgi:hypothetical protein
MPPDQRKPPVAPPGRRQAGGYCTPGWAETDGSGSQARDGIARASATGAVGPRDEDHRRRAWGYMCSVISLRWPVAGTARLLEFMPGDRKDHWLADGLEDLDYGDIDGICSAARAYPLAGVKKNEPDMAPG